GVTFPECEPLWTKVPKLLGLLDDRKMSKSLGNHLPMPTMCDADQLWAKLKPAITDPARVTKKDPGNPDVCNIFTLHKFFSDEATQAEMRAGCTTAAIGCIDCKKRLFAGLAADLGRIQARAAALRANPGQVDEILSAGAARARVMARDTMATVRARLGLGAPLA
ncbi:MAG TPA: tryptophan--tRNA ligase, partial [Polyangia bacterium]|nr:tryptophan--tRNA ligase [Polyangia bacterium]